MKTCRQIAEAIVTGQPLDERQRAHLDHCPDCATLAASEKRLRTLADWHRRLDEPTTAQYERALYGQAARPVRRRHPRLLLAATAAIVLLALTSWLWLSRGVNNEVDAAGRLWALLEEVDQVVQITPEDDRPDWSLTTLSVLAGTGQDGDSGSQAVSSLPKSWQALELVLGEIVI